MGLNQNLSGSLINLHNTLSSVLNSMDSKLNALYTNQEAILAKMDVIDASIKNINTGTTGPTEPDPGPTEPDEPIPVVPKLKFSDTTNISNFSVKINDTIYTSDNWTPDLTIDITDGQNLNFEIWADNYYLFDTNPGIAITSNDNTKAVSLLPINGKYTGSTSLASTLTNDIILDIRAAARLQPYNANDPTEPFDPLHPDTPALLSVSQEIFNFDGTNNHIKIPAGFKIVKMYIDVTGLMSGQTLNVSGLKDGNISINTDGYKCLHDVFKNNTDILTISVSGTNTFKDDFCVYYSIYYTPRTDITITSTTITSDVNPLDRHDYWISQDSIKTVKLKLTKYSNTSTLDLAPDIILDLSKEDYHMLSLLYNGTRLPFKVYNIKQEDI